jgi:hypothetical protein
MLREILPCPGSFVGAADKHSEVYGHMGMEYEKLHNTDVAIEVYTVQVQTGQNNHMGAHAKQRLAELKKTSIRSSSASARTDYRIL